MAEKKTSIVLAHHYGDNKPGDTIKVDPDEAKRLIRAGYGKEETTKSSGS